MERKCVKQMTVKKMSDGTYDVQGHGTTLCGSFYGQNLTKMNWAAVEALFQRFAPAELGFMAGVTSAIQAQIDQKVCDGTGRSMEDAAYRTSIAKLADDLERIKRARGGA